MIYYMHLIDGQPAYFDARSGQIVFANRQSASRPVQLRNSLYQIKDDQRTTRLYRKSLGYELSAKYSHIRVAIQP